MTIVDTILILDWYFQTNDVTVCKCLHLKELLTDFAQILDSKSYDQLCKYAMQVCKYESIASRQVLQVCKYATTASMQV